MSEEQALIPTVQKTVTFYEDEITAVSIQTADGQEIYVPIGQFCELLGVNRRTQMQKINDDAVLSRKIANITVSSSGGPQATYCLPLDYLNGWLFGINANRVKPDVRDRLILYQEKCYKVLVEAFREGRLSTNPALDDLLNSSDSPSAQAYRMLQALTQLARNQVIMEARLDSHENQLADYGGRLEEIEATLSDPQRFVTSAQASRLSQAVKAVALALGKQTNRNEFGGIYGELYRKFEVTSYKEIPTHQYREAMDFLSEWYTTLTNESLPF
ncbi:MAG: ORF6C domain-containing protein [Chloroflexi bacterium]|nr:ORF6C domain-containing protein [Chloroflexota bacterium]